MQHIRSEVAFVFALIYMHPKASFTCYVIRPFLLVAPLIFVKFYNVMVEQCQRSAFNPFENSDKNGAKTLRVNQA